MDIYVWWCIRVYTTFSFYNSDEPSGDLVMPKIKTSRAAAKRFAKTGSGKYKFRKSHASHILTKKTTKRKRSLRQPQTVADSDMKAVRRMLPNG